LFSGLYFFWGARSFHIYLLINSKKSPGAFFSLVHRHNGFFSRSDQLSAARALLGNFERSSNEKINATRIVITQNRLPIQGAVAGVVLVTYKVVDRVIDQNSIKTIGIA